MKKRLKTFNISENLYNSLIDYFTDGKHRVGHDFIEGTRLVKMDQKDFIHGTKYKINPKIDVNRQCLCVTLLNLPTEYTDNIKSSYANYDFYQIILKCNREQKEDEFILDYSPLEAVKQVNKALDKVYTKDEQVELLNAHQLNEWIPQLHHVRCHSFIRKFTNCYYYDINGAHTYLLSKIFPKAEDQFKYWNDHKHDEGKSHYKAISNYYAGCLGRENAKTRLTYQWIINEVNKIMYQAFETTKNTLELDEFVYVNTDGFIVSDPIKELKTSKELGDFKLVYHGDVYTYHGKNYWIIQYGDEIKGNLPLSLRKHVDLRQNKVIEFDIKVKDGIKFYENVKEITLN